MTKFCIYQGAPSNFKKVVTNFVFIQNASFLIQNKRLLAPRSPYNYQVLYLFKTPLPLLLQKKRYKALYLFKKPPSSSKKRGYYHKGSKICGVAPGSF